MHVEITRQLALSKMHDRQARADARRRARLLRARVEPPPPPAPPTRPERAPRPAYGPAPSLN